MKVVNKFFALIVIIILLLIAGGVFAYAYLAKDSGVCELPQPFNDE